MAHETTYNDLKYMPPPPAADGFWEQFNTFVPLSENGVDRAFRWVWGCDRLEYYAGEWDRRYGDTDHDPVEYVGRTRWVLEMWTDPNLFNRDEWKKHEALLGEWPRQGTWDFVAFHVIPSTQEYLPLDESALNHTRIYVDRRENGTMKSVAELVAQKQALWAKRAAERKAKADKIGYEFGDAVVKVFENDKKQVTTSGKAYKQTAGGIFIPNK